jgi:hypothetical protein
VANLVRSLWPKSFISEYNSTRWVFGTRHGIEEPRGRGGIGRRTGLDANLSARRETGDVELLKFGETFKMATPSQAQTDHSVREGVETRRAAPNPRHIAGVW